MGAVQIVKTFLGESAETIEAELDREKEAAALACHEIERLERRRLQVENWSEAEAIDTEIKKHRWRIGKAEKRFPEIQARLTLAKTQAREKLRRKLLEPVERVTREYLRQAKVTQTAFSAIVAVKRQLEEHGFGIEARSLALPAHINGSPFLAPDLLELAERDLDRRKSSSRRVDATPLAVKQTPALERIPHIASPTTQTLLAPRARRVVRKDPKPSDLSMVLVDIIRAGIELDDGSSACAGDRVAMRSADARRLVLAGAADYSDLSGVSTSTPPTDEELQP